MKKLFLAMGLAIGVGSAAMASGPAFKALDGNGDGKISREEAAAAKGVDFAKTDTNHDGVLEPSEYAAVEASGGGGPATDVEPDGVAGRPRGMAGKPGTSGLPGNATP